MIRCPGKSYLPELVAALAAVAPRPVRVTVDRVWVEEAAEISPEAWQRLAKRESPATHDPEERKPEQGGG